MNFTRRYPKTSSSKYLLNRPRRYATHHILYRRSTHGSLKVKVNKRPKRSRINEHNCLKRERNLIFSGKNYSEIKMNIVRAMVQAKTTIETITIRDHPVITEITIIQTRNTAATMIGVDRTTITLNLRLLSTGETTAALTATEMINTVVAAGKKMKDARMIIIQIPSLKKTLANKLNQANQNKSQSPKKTRIKRMTTVVKMSVKAHVTSKNK